MPEGSKPYFPAELLALLARLTGSLALGELDTFTNGSGKNLALSLDKGERWGLYPASSPGLGPFLVSKGTLDVIRSGEPDALAALSPLFEGGALGHLALARYIISYSSAPLEGSTRSSACRSSALLRP